MCSFPSTARARKPQEPTIRIVSSMEPHSLGYAIVILDLYHQCHNIASKTGQRANVKTPQMSASHQQLQDALSLCLLSPLPGSHVALHSKYWPLPIWMGNFVTCTLAPIRHPPDTLIDPDSIFKILCCTCESEKHRKSMHCCYHSNNIGCGTSCKYVEWGNAIIHLLRA